MKVRCRRCDICGKEYGSKQFGSLIVKMFDDMYEEVLPPLDRKKLDICNDCRKDMFLWIKERKSKDVF